MFILREREGNLLPGIFDSISPYAKFIYKPRKFFVYEQLMTSE